MITELNSKEINHLNFIVNIPKNVVEIFAKEDITEAENEQAELFFTGLTIAMEARARVAANLV
jgi:hypothetical protein